MSHRSLAHRTTGTRGVGHRPHPPAAPITGRAGCWESCHGEEEMGTAGHSLGPCWHTSHACPCLIPASPGCRGACQSERNTPGGEPPQNPQSPSWNSARREVGWGQAQGGCARWQRVPWHSDDSRGSWHIPRPPSKPVSWRATARGGFTPPGGVSRSFPTQIFLR